MQRFSENIKYLILTVFMWQLAHTSYGQDDLLSQLETNQGNELVTATFKSARIINGHSIETRDEGALDFIISHRFGRLNSGIENFFGLDDSNIRLGLDYAVSDRFTIGVGRSSFKKIYDGFLKYKLLQQRENGTPVTITAFLSGAIETLDRASGLDLEFRHELSYVSELLIARKFSPNFSLQIMPLWIHRNLVDTPAEENEVFALGVAGRQKITKRTALMVEYYYRMGEDKAPVETFNSIGIGVDIETGGHVFQLHVTNSRSIIEKEFVPYTTGDFFGGDIHFGFNIIRVFQLKKPKLEKIDN